MARKAKSPRSHAACEGLGLLDFVPAVSPDMMPPTHVAPFVKALEGADRGRKRVVVAVPCQHGKSQTLFHAVAWMLLRNPRMTILYASYSKAFAWRNSRTMRRLAETAGVDLSDDHNTVAEWQTSEHGGLVATSVDGEATGYKVDVVLIDDPYKNRGEAENARHREEVEAWLTGVILPRLTPTGSCFIVASRWHPEDLSGAMIAKGWENITLPAISAEGEALCPWGPDPENPRDINFLLKLKEEIGEYDFQSLYQGNPKPPGGAVFRGATYAEAPPTMRGAFGVDLSYSGGASTDHSVVVTLAASGPGRAHVLDVTRWRAGFGEAGARLQEIQGRYPGTPFVSYAYGPEKGALQSLATGERKVVVHALKVASVSKMIRAQRTAEAWNAGRITIQKDAPWARAFVRELEQFTGSGNDSADDQVDALVAAFDFVCGATPLPERITYGRRRI